MIARLLASVMLFAREGYHCWPSPGNLRQVMFVSRCCSWIRESIGIVCVTNSHAGRHRHKGSLACLSPGICNAKGMFSPGTRWQGHNPWWVTRKLPSLEHRGRVLSSAAENKWGLFCREGDKSMGKALSFPSWSEWLRRRVAIASLKTECPMPWSLEIWTQPSFRCRVPWPSCPWIFEPPLVSV